jgi:hypothetical protein
MLFRALGENCYVLTDADHGIEFHVDHLRRDRHELVGELRVVSGMLGTRAIDGVLSVATFNFSSASARVQRSKFLAERARTNGKVDFLARLEEVSQRVLEADRRGQPAISLRDLPAPTADQYLEVDGFKFPRAHPTIVFGDGGTAKSYHALRDAGVLTSTGVPTGYVDWELDAGEHRRRLERLFGRDMPALRYIRCERPLIHEVDRLRRLIREHRLEYLMLDSVAFGTDGPPESAESAMAYCRAVRQLGIGTRLIAHVTKATGDQADQRPFGSVFWHNSARATWFVKLAHTSTDGRLLTIGLYNRKTNLGPQLPAVGYAIDFDPDRTTFSRINVADIGELAEGLPLWQRIREMVKHGPKTLAELADELDSKPDTVKKAVQRHPNVFTRVSREGVHHIALVERRAS